MKAIILAGGFGTRISEESYSKPKPMIEIGDRPIIWHIMKHYSFYGINEFIICLGYKGYLVKEYFANYFLHMSDVTINVTDNQMDVHDKYSEPWRVTLVDTGLHTSTGGRIKRISKYLQGESMFCLTYGDGLSDVNIGELMSFHKSHGKLATITAVTPPGRFGALVLEEDRVMGFSEKPKGDGGVISGGFFVLSPEIFNEIDDDGTSWEEDTLNRLASKGELMSFNHQGFWQPMDTLRDKNSLEKIWNSGQAPWKIWE